MSETLFDMFLYWFKPCPQLIQVSSLLNSQSLISVIRSSRPWPIVMNIVRVSMRIWHRQTDSTLIYHDFTYSNTSYYETFMNPSLKFHDCVCTLHPFLITLSVSHKNLLTKLTLYGPYLAVAKRSYLKYHCTMCNYSITPTPPCSPLFSGTTYNCIVCQYFWVWDISTTGQAEDPSETNWSRLYGCPAKLLHK